MRPHSTPAPDNRDHQIRLKDGRRLAYTDLGNPLGYPLLFGHGMPGCRLEGHFLHERARRYGFRIITPDRPGIGGSDYRQRQTLLEYADDIRQLIDALNVPRFSHLGWSSGGSRVLACGNALADRMDLGVCLSGYTHFSEFPGHNRLIESTRWPGPRLARMSPTLLKLVVRLVVRFSRRHPGLYMREARQLVSEQDRSLLRAFLKGEYFRRDQLECLNSGARAIASDLLTELGDWGFKLKSVKVPIFIYQGEQDPFIPVDYARHLADNLPDAELILMPEAGHLYPLAEQFQDYLFQRLDQYLNNQPQEQHTAP
ncbi:alpha/beta fold hydrolase [Marinobacter sp.]|uniref:alpha/beta fold hydrolase n=1 Tax=Marinobacter sp. TaxID=50741 RepID=UPI003A8F4197